MAAGQQAPSAPMPANAAGFDFGAARCAVFDNGAAPATVRRWALDFLAASRAWAYRHGYCSRPTS